MAVFDGFGWSKLPGELLQKWPKDDSGELVAPRFLAHCQSVDMSDTLLINMLASFGVPAVVLHPGDGDFGKVILGMSGTGSDIYVPENMYDFAKELMEAEPDDDLQSGI